MPQLTHQQTPSIWLEVHITPTSTTVLMGHKWHNPAAKKTESITYFYDADGSPLGFGYKNSDGAGVTRTIILSDGKIKSVDAFIGWASRVIGKLLKSVRK